jgi:hypothetical protein
MALLTKRSPLVHKQFDRSRSLLFMHIPKTAGSSLHAALFEALHPSIALKGFDLVHFGSFSDFSSIREEIRRTIYFFPDAMPARAELVSGHIACSSLCQRFPRGQLITVLREPVSRILSHWLYWRSLTDDQLMPWGSWGDLAKQSRLRLTEFLNSRRLACDLDNVIVRMLLWPHKPMPVDDFIDPHDDRRLLAQAWRILRNFDFVDVIENPRLSDNLQEWLKYPFALARLNETARVPDLFRVHSRRNLLGRHLICLPFDLGLT